MQYDKHKIYFKNNEDMIIKNNMLNNYSNNNINESQQLLLTK